MKKLLALTLAVVMTLLLASCAFVPPPNEEQPEPSRGNIEGNVYTSEYLGISFTKPGSWVYSTDEEIAAAVNISVDMMLGDNFKNTIESTSSIFDMMVVDTNTRTNINIGFENLSLTFASNITVEQYIQALENQLANVSGMTVSFPETFETVMLGQTEFTKVECTTTMQGVSMKQVYYLNKLDKFMRFVILTIPSGYTTEQVEAMFD